MARIPLALTFFVKACAGATGSHAFESTTRNSSGLRFSLRPFMGLISEGGSYRRYCAAVGQPRNQVNTCICPRLNPGGSYSTGLRRPARQTRLCLFVSTASAELLPCNLSEAKRENSSHFLIHLRRQTVPGRLSWPIGSAFITQLVLLNWWHSRVIAAIPSEAKPMRLIVLRLRFELQLGQARPLHQCEKGLSLLVSISHSWPTNSADWGFSLRFAGLQRIAYQSARFLPCESRHYIPRKKRSVSAWRPASVNPPKNQLGVRDGVRTGALFTHKSL